MIMHAYTHINRSHKLQHVRTRTQGPGLPDHTFPWKQSARVDKWVSLTQIDPASD